MNNKLIEILVRAKDEASSTLGKVAGSIETTSKTAERSSGVVRTLQQNWAGLAGVAVSTGIAFRGLTGFITANVDEAIRLQSALLGLNSIAKAFKQDAGKAEQAARELAKDGLMTVTDAAVGLKNLLASGFSLDQAVTLMNRFKDSAAFGRQSALGFGQAIASATEGIKNGNSILVDNAGVTKNLSIILEEAGFSAQDLMKATTDASVRQAIYNGILKETTPMLGDATKLADSYAGSQAAASAQVDVLQAKIGMALQPVLLRVLETITPLIVKFAEFTDKHPTLVSNIIIVTTVVTGLTFALGTLGFAIAGLGPIWAVMSAVAVGSMATVRGAFIATRALILTPMIMPAIAVAAAIGSIYLVTKAANEARQAVEGAQAAARSASKSNDAVIRQLTDLKKNGTPEQKARATKALQGLADGGAFATGVTNFGGGWAMVGDVFGSRNGELMHLPKGTDVYSNRESRDMLSGKAVTINQTNNIFNQVDLDLANFELGWSLKHA